MTRAILDAMSAFDTELPPRNNLRRPRIFAMEAAAQAIKNKLQSEIRILECPKDILETWNRFVESGLIGNLGLRELKLLAWNPAVSLDERFIRYLGKHFEIPPLRVVKGIVVNYFLHWEVVRNRGDLVSWLNKWIRAVRLQPPFSVWHQHFDMLISLNAAKNLGSEILDTLPVLEHLAKNLKIPIGSQLFVQGTYRSGLELAKKLSTASERECQFLLREVLGSQVLNPELTSKVLEKILLSDRADKESALQEEIKTIILGHPGLGDPRVNWRQWQNVADDATARFVKWLSMEDIETFFNVIMGQGNDTHDRRPFWLQFVGSVKRSRVFVSKSDRANRRVQLGELEKANRSFRF